MTASRHKHSSDDVRRLDGCEMELARGASHIASMLYEQTIHAAVTETLLEFEACSGREDLCAFAHALLLRLEKRGKPEAVRLLHHFIEHGRLPEPTADMSAIPVPCPKRIVSRAESDPVNDDGRAADGYGVGESHRARG